MTHSVPLDGRAVRGARPVPSPRQIDRAHLATLVAADVRRLGPGVARSAAAVLGVLVLALATGAGKRGFVAGLTGAILTMHPMFLAMQVAKDKVDGTLEFLCALPVTPRTLAAARLVPILALSALAGVAVAAFALWNGAPAALGHPPAVVAATALLVGALVPAALAAVVLALTARLRFEALVSAPMFLLLGLAALSKGLDRAVPPAVWEQLRALAARPWAPAALLALLTALLAATIVLAFGATARTFARFTPEARGG